MEWELEGDPVIAVMVAALACALLVLIISWWRRPRTSAPPAATANFDLAASMPRLQDEMRELTRDAGARLDSKMRALRDLLDESQFAIEELRRLRHVAPPDSLTPGRDPRPARTAAKADSPATAAHAAVVAREQPAAASARPERAVAAEAAPATIIDYRALQHARVRELAAAGLDAIRIAAQTGMPRGEVELVLSLDRTHRTERGRSEPARADYTAEEALV